jgi:hypothetical protein
MRWLLWREVVVMTRTRSLWVAMCMQLLVLASFIVVWGDGVPMMAGNVLGQFSTLQVGLLLVILPWAAARLVGDGRTVALVAAIGACSPRQVVVARFLALLLVLLAVAASALPLTLLALRISTVDVWRGALHLPPVVVQCTLAAAIATVSVVAGASRVVAWVLGTVAALFTTLISPSQGPTVMLAALVLTGLTALRADERLGYLPIGGSR